MTGSDNDKYQQVRESMPKKVQSFSILSPHRGSASSYLGGSITNNSAVKMKMQIKNMKYI